MIAWEVRHGAYAAFVVGSIRRARTRALSLTEGMDYAERMTTLQFRNEDARIAYLATVYHLGRPGSETNRDTAQKHDLGLQAIHDAMLPELDHAVVEVDASPFQILKLNEALLGVTNELKQFSISEGRSAVPRFADTMGWLYPETKGDPGVAMDIVAHAVMLQRRLGGALANAQREVETVAAATHPAAGSDARPWWQFWRRGG